MTRVKNIANQNEAIFLKLSSLHTPISLKIPLFATSWVERCLITSLQAVECMTSSLISQQLQHAGVGCLITQA